MGEEVQETVIYDSCGQVFAFGVAITDEMRDKAIALLCEKLQVSIVQTNATKHGHTELVLKDEK